MTYIDKLKEALALEEREDGRHWGALEPIYDAASRYLALLESWPNDEMVEAATKGMFEHEENRMFVAGERLAWEDVDEIPKRTYREAQRAALASIRDLLEPSE